EALALECLLLDGRHAQAQDRLPAVLETAGQGDYFDRLRAAAYARLLGRGDLLVTGDPATTDRSEFLFSVAVRAERAGLDAAAWQLFRTFVDDGGPAEPRLRLEAAGRAAEARGRLTRVAGTALAARLCAATPDGAAQA